MMKIRYYHGCGAFHLEDKLVLIVAESYDGSHYEEGGGTVEFLVLTDDEPMWVFGKKSFVQTCIFWHEKQVGTKIFTQNGGHGD